MHRFFKRILLLIPCLLLFLFSGCQKTEGEITKVKDLDYTVVEEADLPDPLLELINKKKINSFCLTYKSDSAFYICQGFGAQQTSGYSIQVEEMFLGTNAIYIKNTLLGPGKDELVLQTVTHPFIVLKIELMDYNVIFQ